MRLRVGTYHLHRVGYDGPHDARLQAQLRMLSRYRLVINRRPRTSPWVHGLAEVELRLTEPRRRIRFLAGHAAPSRTHRLAEAEMVGFYMHEDVICAGSLSAASLTCDTGPITPDSNSGTGRAPVRGWDDIRPARELAECGFTDVEAHMGDTTPTVRGRPGMPAYRPDRIYTTLPTHTITGYGVEDAGDLSPHHLAWAQNTLTPETLHPVQHHVTAGQARP